MCQKVFLKEKINELDILFEIQIKRLCNAAKEGNIVAFEKLMLLFEGLRIKLWKYWITKHSELKTSLMDEIQSIFWETVVSWDISKNKSAKKYITSMFYYNFYKYIRNAYPYLVDTQRLSFKKASPVKEKKFCFDIWYVKEILRKTLKKVYTDDEVELFMRYLENEIVPFSFETKEEEMIRFLKKEFKNGYIHF